MYNVHDFTSIYMYIVHVHDVSSKFGQNVLGGFADTSRIMVRSQQQSTKVFIVEIAM